MPKNILIFSDGTGQSGGVTFDEDRTNIYKLFRATRCGPDSAIRSLGASCLLRSGFRITSRQSLCVWMAWSENLQSHKRGHWFWHHCQYHRLLCGAHSTLEAWRSDLLIWIQPWRLHCSLSGCCNRKLRHPNEAAPRRGRKVGQRLYQETCFIRRQTRLSIYIVAAATFG
jgi:hypothetical protein